MRVALAAALLAACAGCATTPAGDDERGRALKAQAVTVQDALARYHDERGRYPDSLHELVPRFLPAVPFEPGLRYERDAGMLAFSYRAPWPGGRVACVAPLARHDWDCRRD